MILLLYKEIPQEEQSFGVFVFGSCIVVLPKNLYVLEVAHVLQFLVGE